MTTSAAIKQYRHNRRDKGLCGQVGCKVSSGADYYCEVHAQKHADRQKRRRADAKAAREARP